jgi:predicted DsbA family dithiol-disulfide isomerase/uncharacterized membrane protein
MHAIPPRIRSLAALALGLAGLCSSTALLVDSLGPAPAFCGEGGCAEVRSTVWAHPLGVPMPLLGVAFFTLALALGCTRAVRARRAVALVGAAGALGLLAIQGFVIGAWCRLCVVTDVIVILHATVVLIGPAWPAARRRRVALTAAAGALAFGLPMAALRESPAPLATATSLPDLVARAELPGSALVVDFVDFECPFCRAFHARLTSAIAEAAVPVRVVRVMVPLAQHRGALPAAVAWCCAENQGRGDEMADRLLAAADLDPASLERLAGDLGLDLARYRADAASPATRARIEADAAMARSAGVRSLPTIYIGHRRFVGARASVAELVAALRAAAS